MSFKEELRTKTEEIEKLLTTYLPQETGFQKTVLEAVNYSVLAGGKRLRPLLMKKWPPWSAWRAMWDWLSRSRMIFWM